MDTRINVAINTRKPEDGSVAAAPDCLFTTLPGEVLERILAFTYATEAKDGASLSLTCKLMRAWSNKPLAATLVQLLKAADEPRADANSKRRKALKLAASKPFLMFTRPEKTVPCAAAYAAGSADVYLLNQFLNIAKKTTLTSEWLSASENTETACSVSASDFPAAIVEQYKKYDLPDNYLLPLFHAYQQLISILTEPHQNYQEWSAKMSRASEFTKKQLGSELAKLKRWFKDELFRPFESWRDEQAFAELEPVEDWIADDFNMQDLASPVVRVNDYQAGSVLGVDLAIYRGVDEAPAVTRNILVVNTCMEDFTVFARLYNNRKKRQNELVAAVRNSLQPAMNK